MRVAGAYATVGPMSETLGESGDPCVRVREVSERSAALVEALVGVWERSVRATHLFLSDGEVRSIREYVPQALGGVARLVVAEDGAGAPIAFMGVEDGALEMLFVDAAWRGRGVGRRLLGLGVERLGVRRLTVNEQNPQARGFYERQGFRVCGRSETDGQGRPYPLLHMRLP